MPAGVSELPAGAAGIELVATPFYPQDEFQCGPAALATALGASGVEVDLDDLVSRVYLPGKRGSLQAEMLAATRTSHRLAYRIEGTLAALHAELGGGRPVVVLQNLGIAAIPRWHYAVVAGVDPASGVVVLRSGTDRRRVTAVKTFLRTWQRSGYWAFVALRPGELPARLEQGRYFSAVAALESAAPAAAIPAWQAALQRWPGNPTALFGLGNARLAGGDAAAAIATYRDLLAGQPDLTVARNNLALALARDDQLDAALEEIRLALADNHDAALQAELQDTEASILRLIGGPAER